jgi:hypothetical protein
MSPISRTCPFQTAFSEREREREREGERERERKRAAEREREREIQRARGVCKREVREAQQQGSPEIQVFEFGEVPQALRQAHHRLSV